MHRIIFLILIIIELPTPMSLTIEITYLAPFDPFMLYKMI